MPISVQVIIATCQLISHPTNMPCVYLILNLCGLVNHLVLAKLPINGGFWWSSKTHQYWGKMQRNRRNGTFLDFSNFYFLIFLIILFILYSIFYYFIIIFSRCSYYCCASFSHVISTSFGHLLLRR